MGARFTGALFLGEHNLLDGGGDGTNGKDAITKMDWNYEGLYPVYAVYGNTGHALGIEIWNQPTFLVAQEAIPSTCSLKLYNVEIRFDVCNYSLRPFETK